VKRCEFITLVGGMTAAWPLAAGAQQPGIPVIGFVDLGSAVASAHWAAAFRNGLNETGYSDGKNVTVEYHWLEGRYDRLPALMAELVGRRVAVIATPNSIPASLAAKAATATIPIVFLTGIDPVEVGLVASLSRPGGNMTGVANLSVEVGSKQLQLLHELVPAATVIALLVNPTNRILAETLSRDLQAAGRAISQQIRIVDAFFALVF
jgi:putative tryptophan/tyrosine transport system substrate-binding protein